MLSKLIRYDLKYGAKMFWLLHGLLFIAVLIGRFLFLDHINFHASAQPLVSSLIIFISVFLLLISIIPMGTTLLIAVRFYKNLFTDEGYLSFTLPVSPVQHLWSKIISGMIWLILDTLLTYTAMYILVSGNNVQALYTEHAAEFTAALGMPVSEYFLMLMVISLINTISTVLMIYSSVSIGQLFPAHRLLCAVIAYFVFSSIIYVLTIIFMFIMGIIPGMEPLDLNSTTSEVMSMIFVVSIVLSFITAVIQYTVTHYILTKKLNLI